MILKSVTFLEANQYSSWPKRLLGLTHWQKRERSKKEILKEYNDVWYNKTFQLWKNILKLDKDIRPGRFFHLLDEMIKNEIINNFDIYGVSKDEHLLSLNQNLFATNWFVASALYDALLINTIGQYLKTTKATTIIELGCGSGANLFKIYEKLPVKAIIGGEICQNAIDLGNQILGHCQISGKFSFFDYYQKNSLVELTKDLDEKYIIFTSHSIEQIQVKETNLIEQIQKLKRKPEVIIHFEPIALNQDKSMFSELHQLYLQKNLYNSDLFEVLNDYEQKKILKIIDFQKHVIGIGAFNPTSILVWKCLDQKK